MFTCRMNLPPSPSGRDVVGEGRRRADLSGQPEVGDLDGVAAGGQDVLGLQVAVEEPQAVHVRQALKKENCAHFIQTVKTKVGWFFLSVHTQFFCCHLQSSCLPSTTGAGHPTVKLNRGKPVKESSKPLTDN